MFVQLSGWLNAVTLMPQHFFQTAELIELAVGFAID
jgi:hypothetical protein